MPQQPAHRKGPQQTRCAISLTGRRSTASHPHVSARLGGRLALSESRVLDPARIAIPLAEDPAGARRRGLWCALWRAASTAASCGRSCGHWPKARRSRRRWPGGKRSANSRFRFEVQTRTGPQRCSITLSARDPAGRRQARLPAARAGARPRSDACSRATWTMASPSNACE